MFSFVLKSVSTASLVIIIILSFSDASISREVRAADADKKCQKKLRTKDRKKGKGYEKRKCRKGMRGRSGKEGKRRKAKGGKGGKGKKRKRGRSGKEKKEKGKKGEKSKKGRKKKSRKRKNGKGKGKGKKARRFRNSGRNVTVPAKCTASACTNTDYVNLFNDYKKVLLYFY